MYIRNVLSIPASLPAQEVLHMFFLHPTSCMRFVLAARSRSLCSGPLTLILKAAESVPACVTAGTGFVGVRCPAHSVTRQLLSLAGVPVAAPSANRFGHVRYDRWSWTALHLGILPMFQLQVELAFIRSTPGRLRVWLVCGTNMASMHSSVVFPPPLPSQSHSSSSRDGRSWKQRHPCPGW